MKNVSSGETETVTPSMTLELTTAVHFLDRGYFTMDGVVYEYTSRDDTTLHVLGRCMKVSQTVIKASHIFVDDVKGVSVDDTVKDQMDRTWTVTNVSGHDLEDYSRQYCRVD